MNRIKPVIKIDADVLKDFSGFLEEREIQAKLIQILHEGVRMTHVSMLNEGFSKYPELDRLLKKANDEGSNLLIAEFVPEIEALVDKFGQSGQSGGSAPFTAGAIISVIKKMLAHEPLGDGIYCTDDEWNDISGPSCEPEGTTYQNNRLSSVFKEERDGKPYYLDAIVFKSVGKNYTFTSGGVGTTEGSDETVGSSQYIKSLPFQPKSFTIDVHEKEYKKLKDGTLVEEPGGGWWESWLADPKQLDEVWEYYDRRETKKK